MHTIWFCFVTLQDNCKFATWERSCFLVAWIISWTVTDLQLATTLDICLLTCTQTLSKCHGFVQIYFNKKHKCCLLHQIDCFEMVVSQFVGKKIKNNFKFLKNLAKTRSPKNRKHLLKTATRDELLAVLEVCVNILNSRFKLHHVQKKRLAVHAPFLRKLSKVRTEKSARTILQRGNGAVFAPLLIPIISALVGSLISSA